MTDLLKEISALCGTLALGTCLTFGLIAYDSAGKAARKHTTVTHSEGYKIATACRHSLFSRICYSKTYDEQNKENELDCRINTVNYLTFTQELYWDKDCDDTLDFVSTHNNLFGTNEEEKFSPPKSRIAAYDDYYEFFSENDLKKKSECMFEDPEFFEKHKILEE